MHTAILFAILTASVSNGYWALVQFNWPLVQLDILENSTISVSRIGNHHRAGTRIEYKMKMTHVASACGLFGAMALAVLTGCESTEHSSGRSEGRRMDDKELSARVKDDLENEPVYKFDGVYVRTYGGIVQLSGFVNSEDQKR